MKALQRYYLFFIFLFGMHIIQAQDDKIKLERMIQNDSSVIGILASYPPNVRDQIFEVSSHPETIIRLGDLQAKSKEDFRQLISSYSKEEQKEIWDLMRYDGLIGKLTDGEMKSTSQIEEILKGYPEEARSLTLKYAQNSYYLLVSLNRINQDFEKAFIDLKNNLPVKTQTALSALIKEPEAVSSLNKNMHTTVELGDVYKRDPSLVSHVFDSLNLELARQKAKDKAELEQAIKENPQAAEELKKSAGDYAHENGYSENEYRETDPEVIVHYHYYPYPYWCGYPWWYETDYWYPYPYWYHWGFYFWHGNMVWLGPPSPYFMYWHFYHHNNFYTYPHLTDLYITHYYGPRKTAGANSRVVNRWAKDNEKSLPRNFFVKDDHRIDRIKEYGKFESDYIKHVVSDPKPIKRTDFIKQHPADYPNLQQIDEIRTTKETSPVKQQSPVRKNEVIPDRKVKSNEENYPVKPERNPAIKPQRDQAPQPSPRTNQQERPKVVVPQKRPQPGRPRK